MKNIIKKFMTSSMFAFLVVATVVGVMPIDAQAATGLQSSFDTLRAANYSDSPGSINWNDNGSPTTATGDANGRPIVALGIAYKNNTGATVQGVTVRLSPTSGGSQTSFNGRVWGNGVNPSIGNATVTLPSGQTLAFTGDLYWYKNGASTPIHLSTSASTLSSGYVLGSGSIPAGEYGGVVAHFKATAPVAPQINLDVETLPISASSVTNNSATLRGETNGYGSARNAWYEYATSPGDLSGEGDGSDGGLTTSQQTLSPYNGWLQHNRSVSGLQPATTYYYQICASIGSLVQCDPHQSFTTTGQVTPVDVCPNIDGPQTTVPSGYELVNGDCVPENVPQNENVQTNNANSIGQNSATLNGEVTSGTNVDTWFALSTSSNPSCSSISQQQAVSGLFDAGDDFLFNATGLQNNTTYYFRACSTNDSGNVLGFTTNGQIQNNTIQIDTWTAQNEDEDSALLRGYVTEEEDGNVSVWFEWDDSSSVVSNGNGSTLSVPGTYNQNNSFDRVLSGLQENETYYFRACGQDQNGNQDCGSVESFSTDGNSNGQDPDVQTDSATGVDEESATLNGEYDMNDFDDGDVFFVWSDDQDDLDDVEDEDNINDVEDFAEVEIFDNNVDDADDADVEIDNLDEDTTYYFRLCVLYENADGDDEITCGSTRNFTTNDGFDDGEDVNRPIPGVCVVSNVGVTSATLSSLVNGNGGSTNSYFQYGPTTGFGSISDMITSNSSSNFLSRFISGLAPNTQYYCRMVSENADGVSYSDIGTFRTGSLPNIPGDRPVVIVSSGGTGTGSPIFLEIDDNQDMAVRGQTLAYEVTWENTSGGNLDSVVLNVSLPKSVRFLSSTKGMYNKRDHYVTVNIGELERGDADDMTIFTQVRGGTEGDQLVAEAIIAFESPQEDSGRLLSAIEYDVDTYSNGGNGQLAGLFGIGILPGIIGILFALLLILIIVLVARRLTDPRRTEYRG
ncbi:MAG: hypothetical protein KBC22_00400 [Candidatus Pacebacteria bacterium]|nr:hypothetical protein [Candidatus Paceibacterota bacterium]